MYSERKRETEKYLLKTYKDLHSDLSIYTNKRKFIHPDIFAKRSMRTEKKETKNKTHMTIDIFFDIYIYIYK